MEQEIQLNEHNKAEYPPIHTAGFNPSLNDVIIYQTEDGEIKICLLYTSPSPRD